MKTIRVVLNGKGAANPQVRAALKLAAEGTAKAIDVPSANGVHFANVASGGFGAEVTVGTNPQLKKALSGGAYTLTGLVTAAKMTPYEGKLIGAEDSEEGAFIAMAVGNARQAGGGLQVTQKAFLDDGLLDLMVIGNFLPTRNRRRAGSVE